MNWWMNGKGDTSFGLDVPVKYPLKNREDWNNYSFPDINKNKNERLKGIKIALKKSKENNIAVFGQIRGPFTSVLRPGFYLVLRIFPIYFLTTLN